MDSKEMMAQALPEVWKLKEPDQNSPASSKQSVRTEEQERERLELLRSRIPDVMSRNYKIPAKFIRMDLKNVPLAIDNRGICLTGKVGVGKTMSLCLTVRDWLLWRVKNSQGGYFFGEDTKRTWRFIVFPEFIMRVQDAFNHKKGEETAWEMLEEIAKVPRLIIDDLGAEKPTEYVRQATYFIINHREMNLLPTYITTNFSMDHLDENLDPRISSRIAGMCDIIRMEGNDRRLAWPEK